MNSAIYATDENNEISFNFIYSAIYAAAETTQSKFIITCKLIK